MKAYIRKAITGLILILLFLCQGTARAQRPAIDSLEHVLKTAAKDASRVHLLYQLAVQYSLFEGNSANAQSYMEQTCEWAHALRYELGEAFCWDIRGVFYRNASMYPQALEYHNRALRIGKAVGDPEAIATIHNNIGVVYRRMGSYQEALFHHLAALRLAESINHRRNISVAVNSVGNIYLALERIQEALQYFNRALRTETESNNPLGVAINLNNIGAVHQQLRQYEQAEKLYAQSLEINQRLKNAKGTAICYNDLGNIQKLMGRPEEALNYYTRALQMHQESGDKSYIASNYNNIGIAYLELGKYPEAINYLQQGLQLAREIGAKEPIQVSHENLSRVYEKMGKHQPALENYRLGVAYKDSILNEKNASYIAQLQAGFDLEKKETRIQLLEKDKIAKEAQLQRRRIIETALASCLGLSLLLFALLYQKNAQKKQINRVLARQNAEISEQKEEITRKNRELLALNEEKNHLIGVVAHDLRSPLSRIHGLANVLKLTMNNLTPEQEQYLSHIESNTAQLNHMIARILDVDAIESHQLNIQLGSVNVDQLLKEIRQYLHERALRKDIRLAYQCLTQLPYAQLDQGYGLQVFENIITNAIKFSPPHSQVHITVRSHMGNIRVEVKDQGPGISAEDMRLLFGKYQKLSARPTAGEPSVGLGLSIVKKYVDAMNGRVWCESEPGKGATFILEFRQCPAPPPAVFSASQTVGEK